MDDVDDSSDEQQLFNVVKTTLADDGRLEHFTGKLRAAVMSMLNGRDNNINDIPKETRVINDLIREYLLWNGYIYTEEFLVAESGSETEKPSRANLAEQLGILDDCNTLKIPLLYYIVYAFQTQCQNDNNT
ncbi:hypothetical protein RI129_009459 [Pyrocoelia pectoralis]|uniref:FGFR1 oncogene partner (FOP) N-terminal dimerisation domain-containing protein n=1 Tax=Pyrocoelia pectoralis TaxID=417401 RepID=A0AAN7ZFU9_9COLE